jgi:hypothetical protein
MNQTEWILLGLAVLGGLFLIYMLGYEEGEITAQNQELYQCPMYDEAMTWPLNDYSVRGNKCKGKAHAMGKVCVWDRSDEYCTINGVIRPNDTAQCKQYTTVREDPQGEYWGHTGWTFSNNGDEEGWAKIENAQMGLGDWQVGAGWCEYQSDDASATAVITYYGGLP